MMSDERGDEQGFDVDAEPPQRPMGWARRASRQVESAGAAFKKIGLKVKLANKLGSKKKKKIEIDETPRLFTFDPSAIQRGASLCDLFETDEVEEDFNEVVDLDDERVEEVVSQELVGKMVDSIWFRGLILGVIVMNAILIGAQTNRELSQKYAWLFFIFDYTVLSIFVCELILKWYNGFTIYWKIGWNILDFFIIIILLLGPTLKFLGSSRILRILRVLRAFRSLRSVSALAGLSVVVQTIFQSIPDMSNIALLLIILMLVLSVVGVFLFGEDFPTLFGNLQSAMFSLFICVTQDGWMGIFDRFKNSPHYMIGAVYFILAITIGAFVFANLVVAVVVTNLDKAVKEVKHENKMREDVLSTKNINTEDETDMGKELPITGMGDVSSKTDMSTQKPLHFGDFKYLTTEKFQNYIILISALEDNLAEYQTIREDLDKIFRLIWELNEIEEEEELETQSETHPPATTAPETLDFKSIGKKGDILSNLMELEQHKLISTRRGSLSGLIKDAARLVPPGKSPGQPVYYNSRRFSRDTTRPTKSKTDLGSGTSLKILSAVDGVPSRGAARSQDRSLPSDAVGDQPIASSNGLQSSGSTTTSERGKSSAKTTSSPPETLSASASDDSQEHEGRE